MSLFFFVLSQDHEFRYVLTSHTFVSIGGKSKSFVNYSSLFSSESLYSDSSSLKVEEERDNDVSFESLNNIPLIQEWRNF